MVALVLIIPLFIMFLLFMIMFKLAMAGAKIACKIMFYGLPFVTAFFAARQLMTTFPQLTDQSDGHPKVMLFVIFAIIAIWFYFMMTRRFVSHSIAMLLTSTTIYMLASLILMMIPMHTNTWRILATVLYAAICFLLLTTNQKVVNQHWNGNSSGDSDTSSADVSTGGEIQDPRYYAMLEADEAGYKQSEKWYLAGMNAVLTGISAYLLANAVCTFVWSAVVPNAMYLNIIQWVFVAVIALATFAMQMVGDLRQ